METLVHDDCYLERDPMPVMSQEMHGTKSFCFSYILCLSLVSERMLNVCEQIPS